MWDDFNSDTRDEIYSQILERAKDQLPEIIQDDNRFVIPDVESSVEGNRTFFRNFREIYSTLNRSEHHFLKFFTNELGTSGNVEGPRAIFQGKHSRFQISKLLDRDTGF